MLPHFNGVECTSLNLPRDFTKLSVTLESLDHLDAVLSLKSKKRYIEIILPIEFYSESLLSKCVGIQRIILKGTNGHMDSIFAQFVAHKRFPFVIGGKVDKHNVDIYRNPSDIETEDEDLKKFLENENTTARF